MTPPELLLGLLVDNLMRYPDSGVEQIDSVKHWTLVLSVVYAILMVSGQRYMKHRDGFEFRKLLVVWNVVLTTVNIAGSRIFIEELIRSIRLGGLRHSVCSGATNYAWFYVGAFVFCFLKVLELGDTAFVVLRKRPLPFFHWYYHITVMLYMMYSYAEPTAFCRWLMAINSTVHSFMYLYYTGRSLGFRLPKLVSISITVLQIVQLFLGLSIQIFVFTVKYAGEECQQSYVNLAFGLAIYLSYLGLFLHFVYTTYSMAKTSVYHGERKSSQNG